MTPGKVSAGMRLLILLANRNSSARSFMTDWASAGHRTIEFDLRGEPRFHIQIKNGKALFRKGGAERPNVILRGRGSLFARMLDGTVDPDAAYSSQKFDILGSIDDAVRFRYIADLVQGSSRLVRLLRGLLKLAS